jgi:hypothetical protein
MSKVVVYLRVTAGSNLKGRPEWFSKPNCIESLSQAIEIARTKNKQVRMVALVDTSAGELSDDLQVAVSKADSVIRYEAGSSRRSWLTQLSIVLEDVRSGRLENDDFVYLVEDDHLHHPESILATFDMPADYALLYSLSQYPNRPVAASADGVRWFETRQGVSSFAAKVPALSRDKRVLRYMSYAGPAFDLLTWRVLRAQDGFTCREVMAPMRPEPPFERTNLAKALYQVLWRTIANCWVKARRPRVVVAPLPALTTHAESGWLAPGHDWEKVSARVHGGAE